MYTYTTLYLGILRAVSRKNHKMIVSCCKNIFAYTYFQIQIAGPLYLHELPIFCIGHRKYFLTKVLWWSTLKNQYIIYLISILLSKIYTYHFYQAVWQRRAKPHVQGSKRNEDVAANFQPMRKILSTILCSSWFLSIAWWNKVTNIA